MRKINILLTLGIASIGKTLNSWVGAHMENRSLPSLFSYTICKDKVIPCVMIVNIQEALGKGLVH